MVKQKESGEDSEKIFTAEEFRNLNSKASSLRKQLAADRRRVEHLTMEIRSRSTMNAIADPANETIKIHKIVSLSPSEVAARRTQRDQLNFKIAEAASSLKAIDKNLRIASKQISADARQSAAVTRAKFIASMNPDLFFKKIIKRFLEKGDGRMHQMVAQFRAEWAKDPAGIRAEVLASMEKHLPTAHRLIVENPQLEQIVFALLLDDGSEANN